MGDFVSEKKKVGIVTLHGYFNYGNRLQNYAVEQVLRSLGCEVETIVKVDNNINQKSYIDKLKKIKNKDLDEIIKILKSKINNKIYNYKYRTINQKKTKMFKLFSEKYLTEKKYKINENLNKEFDYFVTGSDQVWNPYYNKYPNYEFLDFAADNKKIAFSPSFGVSEIPNSHRNNYKDWLNDFSVLSVRETAGAEIIKNLTGRKAKVLVDPTMLLPAKKWKSLAKKDIHKPNSKYILTYIIGNRLDEWNNQIQHVAKEQKLEIINMANEEDKNRFVSGPQEYLDYFSSAEVIFTDSFHGTIFSILFNKPFVVYERKGTHDMLSRLETLLNKFDLNDRFVENLKDDDIFKIDFTHTNDILNYERDKAYNYLKQSLDIN